jgi:orotate phosphoribosyltransferase-like protein
MTSRDLTRRPQGQRTPEEIRASIEVNRRELGTSIERLRQEVAVVADWRRHLAAHQKQVMIGAAVTGFVLGGGIAAVGGLLRPRRKRRR